MKKVSLLVLLFIFCCAMAVYYLQRDILRDKSDTEDVVADTSTTSDVINDGCELHFTKYLNDKTKKFLDTPVDSAFTWAYGYTLFNRAIKKAERANDKRLVKELCEARVLYIQDFVDCLNETDRRLSSKSYDLELFFQEFNEPISRSEAEFDIKFGYFEKRNGYWEISDDKATASVEYYRLMRILNYLNSHSAIQSKHSSLDVERNKFEMERTKFDEACENLSHDMEMERIKFDEEYKKLSHDMEVRRTKFDEEWNKRFAQ